MAWWPDRWVGSASLCPRAGQSAGLACKGGEHARWVALADLEPESLFEDHFFIIQNFLGLPANLGGV